MAEAHSRISQDLIQAQEEERAQIDGELRRRIDELILAYIYLDRFRQSPFDLQTETPRQLIGDVVSRLVDLSNSLYPRTLDYLGLAGAAASFCKELSVTDNKKITFCSTNVPTELPTNISLCLYRVLQEALQNAIKHSGSEEFEVVLDGRSNEIHLRIRGWGARVENIPASQGELGLVGTSERLKRVNGELLIESQPRHGTTIHVRVPTKWR
jgi:signal transduction histidine kinase